MAKFEALDVFQFHCFRSFLKDSLEARREKNSMYSLRAFARDLKISPSSLCEIIGGQRSLSDRLAFRLSQILFKDGRQREYFRLLVMLERSEDSSVRQELQSKLAQLKNKGEHHEIELDRFQSIADPFHVQILATARLSGYVLNAANLSRDFAVTLEFAAACLERLRRINLLQDCGGGEFALAQEHPVLVKSKDTNAALKRFHEACLKKVEKELRSGDAGDRYFCAETVAIDAARFDDYRKLVDEFIDQVNLLASSSSKRNQVVQCNVQLFKLSQRVKESEAPIVGPRVFEVANV